MSELQAQIQDLQASIAAHERTEAGLLAEVRELENELNTFKERYDRLIQPMLDRISVVKAAIAELEGRLLRPAHALPGYESVEEQYKRVWTKPESAYTPPSALPESEAATPFHFEAPPAPPEADLRDLYRQLARRYHPDYARDEQDRAYRTDLMAQINAAYAEGDTDTLHALASFQGEVQAEEPIALLLVRQLTTLFNALRQRIYDLKQQRHHLMNSDLMKLKIEVGLARSRGRDLLAEMRAEYEAEYKALLLRLESLRS